MKRPWDAVFWWEIRRLPFNALLVLVGLASMMVIELVGSTLVKPGEDVVEPMAIFAGAVVFGAGANVAYALGWITELLWSGGDTAKTEPFRRRVFWLGLSASAVITLVPAFLICVAWAAIRLHRHGAAL